jgi:NADPH:quinone reductase-like Zn-dependent oxidoreductase
MVSGKYGPPDVLILTEMEKPVAGDDQVVVRIHAASLNHADWYMLTGMPMLRIFTGGFQKPKVAILGFDIAGTVESVGKNTKTFQPGDAVFGQLPSGAGGGFAEYVAAPESAFVPKPAGISFEEAAAVPMAGLTALQGLRDVGKIKAGQKVLINGASGGVGTFAVQIAKTMGAEVTAVCSTRNLDLVRSLGADHVIDYTQEDFTTSGEQYDLILAVNGYHPLSAYQRALKPGGTYVMAGGTMAQIFQALLLGPVRSRTGGIRVGSVTERPDSQDLRAMAEMMESGKVKSVIDKRFPLSELPQAMRYLGEVHPRGKVVITMGL